MPGELIRATTHAEVDRRTYRSIARIAGDTRVEQAVIRAKSTVGEFAVSEVAYLKTIQRNYENANPDAGEAIATIINITVASIARSVAQFGSEIDH
jgi:hypothetical protein